MASLLRCLSRGVSTNKVSTEVGSLWFSVCRIWLDLCPLPSFLSHLPLHRLQNLQSKADWIYLILNKVWRQATLNFSREMELIWQNGKEFGQVRLVQWLHVGRYVCVYLAARPVCPLQL
jgi:hypothetical protein